MNSLWPEIKHPKQRAFLAAFCEFGDITAAADEAGLKRESHYLWKRISEDYRAAFALAQEIAGDALEGKVRKRAETSDKLAMFLLRGLKPEKYGTQKVEHSGEGGGPIAISVKFV